MSWFSYSESVRWFSRLLIHPASARYTLFISIIHTKLSAVPQLVAFCGPNHLSSLSSAEVIMIMRTAMMVSMPMTIVTKTVASSGKPHASTRRWAARLKTSTSSSSSSATKWLASA